MSIDPAQEALVGVWRLVTYEDRESEADPWAHTFGKEPIGLAMYHPTGLLAIQVFGGRDSESMAGYDWDIDVSILRTDRT